MRLSLIISVRWLKPTLSLLKWTIPLGSYMLRTLSQVDVINIAVFSHSFCATNIMSYHMQYKSRIGRNKFSKLTVLQCRLLKNVDCELNFVKLIQWYRWRYCSNEKVQVTSSSNYPKLSYSLREKCSNAELFLVRIFLYSVRIWTLFKKQGSDGALWER